MSTLNRRYHTWDRATGVCRRCGLTPDEARGGPLNRIQDCKAPKMVSWTKIQKTRAATWREAAGIAEAHGQIALASRFEEIAKKEYGKKT